MTAFSILYVVILYLKYMLENQIYTSFTVLNSFTTITYLL